MRLAAFGDIHSNHFALKACVNQAERVGIDGVLFLGDYVSDCACPQKTLSLMREIAGRYPAWFIRGNREEYMLAHAQNPGDGWAYNSRSGSLLYTFDNLTRADIAWFAQLPISMRVEIEDTVPFEICHGSLSKSRVLLLPGSREADAAFDEMQAQLLLCAHTHEAFILERDGRVIANGGTLGVPNGRKGAEYLMLEWKNGTWTPDLMRAFYDVEAVVKEFYDSGFMDKSKVWGRCVAATLRTGVDHAALCLKLVEEYAREAGLPFETEALWERAAQKLGV